MDLYAGAKHVHKHFIDQENQRPAKRSKISGLFKSHEAHREPRHVTRPEFSTTTRPIKSMTSSDKHDYSVKARRQQDPIMASFDVTMAEYRRAVRATRKQQLDPIYDKFLARLAGLDFDGNSLHVQGPPSKADKAALSESHALLSQPLADTELQVEVRRSDGTKATREVTIGETIQNLQALMSHSRATLESLLQERRQLDKDIQIAKQAIIDGEDKGIKQVKTDMHAAFDEIVKAVGFLKEQTSAKIAAARTEDETAKKETSRKMKKFIEGL